MTNVPEPLNLARKAQSDRKANVILVGDNALSLLAVLEDFGQNLVDARSG